MNGDFDDGMPAVKSSPDTLHKMLKDAEINLRNKKADKKSAMKAYKDEIDGIEEEIGDILVQLEGAV